MLFVGCGLLFVVVVIVVVVVVVVVVVGVLFVLFVWCSRWLLMFAVGIRRCWFCVFIACSLLSDYCCLLVAVCLLLLSLLFLRL